MDRTEAGEPWLHLSFKIISDFSCKMVTSGASRNPGTRSLRNSSLSHGAGLLRELDVVTAKTQARAFTSPPGYDIIVHGA